MLASIIGIVAGVIALAIYVPYAIDILKGRVLPARSTRIMLTLVLIIVLLQQHELGSGWALGVTVGELVGSLAILGLSLPRGVGGSLKSDLVCYALLAAAVCAWLLVDNPLLALHLSIVADFIAFTPTLIKSWYMPKSETALFYIGGVVSALLATFAAGSFAYSVIVFPLYLVLINGLQLVVMYRPPSSRAQSVSDDTLVG